jgi:hypothetical protein
MIILPRQAPLRGPSPSGAGFWAHFYKTKIAAGEVKHLSSIPQSQERSIKAENPFLNWKLKSFNLSLDKLTNY